MKKDENEVEQKAIEKCGFFGCKEPAIGYYEKKGKIILMCKLHKEAYQNNKELLEIILDREGIYKKVL
jgi:hypothetical protein